MSRRKPFWEGYFRMRFHCLFSRRILHKTIFLLISFICQIHWNRYWITRIGKTPICDKFLSNYLQNVIESCLQSTGLLQGPSCVDLNIVSPMFKSTNIIKIVCIIMLMPVKYADLTWWEPYAIVINMIVHTVFMMFRDLKLVTILYRHEHGKKDAGIRGVIVPYCNCLIICFT